jgi:polyhydroxybutyrate depolymerase
MDVARGTPYALLGFLASVLLTCCGGTSSSSPPQPTPSIFPQVPGLAQRQATFQQVTYPFYVFVPSSYDGSRPLPAILLIHGGGGKGPDMISAWQNFAEQNGIILVGPTLPLGGDFETAVVPGLYPLIMDTARSEWKIDAKRIYVFGYSAGGFTVFDAAMFDSQYFAAGGVFAAVITPDFDWILQKAARKTPLAIYLGDHDQFFTVAQAQRTRDVLAVNAFPVRLVILPNQDHNYAAVSAQVNADVWTFFSQASLP